MLVTVVPSLGSLCDVTGIRVGHHQRVSSAWRTGTTVVLLPPGTRGGVSVRGAAPGTRETDLLGPDTLVPHVDAICLTGGSAFGLDAVAGVMKFLAEQSRGFKVGDRHNWVVPIVPAAVIFDLGRSGHFDNRPDADFGARACRKARPRIDVGAVGAGTGARAGGLQGGVGTASTVTADGYTVAALAVVNSVGSPIDPDTGLPWHIGRWTAPSLSSTRLRRLRDLLVAAPGSSLNTTIGLVATDAPLNKAQCGKMADVAHDGLARAIRPAHSMNDGDCVFAVATGTSPTTFPVSTDPTTDLPIGAVNRLLTAAADVFAESCTGAILTATSIGGPPAYQDFARKQSRPGGGPRASH